MSSIRFLGSRRPAKTEFEQRTLAKAVDEALLKATTDSLSDDVTHEDLEQSWGRFRAACSNASVSPDQPLQKSFILKSLLAEGSLKKLAAASRGIKASCGGIHLGDIGVKADPQDFSYSYHLKTLGGAQGNGTGLLGNAKSSVPGLGVVHAPGWTASGQFTNTKLVGDIVFFDAEEHVSLRFQGEAYTSESLTDWSLKRGTVRRETESGSVVEDGMFVYQSLAQGSRRWADGTQITARCLDQPVTNTTLDFLFRCVWYPRYSGEGAVRWPDGSVHEGTLQLRDRRAEDDESTPQRYLLTAADYTTVYFSLTTDLKPDMQTRRVISAAGAAAPQPAGEAAERNLIDL